MRFPQYFTGAKDGVDKKMLVDMVFWAYDNPPPGNYLLISGDRDFSDLLHRLMMKKYEILLAQPQNASSRALVTAAKTVWLWESLAAGKPELAESPHSHNVPDCNRNSNNVDASNCSHSKARAVHSKSDSNLKAGVKPLQKYVKKSNITSSFAPNHGQLESVLGVSKDSTGRTVSELEQSSVSSSSSSESIDGAKVDQSSLLGTPTLSQLSAQKPEVPAHLHPMEISQGFNRGEEPIKSTKCAPRNGTLDGVSNVYYHQMYQQSKYDNNGKGGNECKMKPLQKYVKKTSITSSSGNQVDSVEVYECSNGTTRNEIHLSTALSSSSKSLEGEIPPGTSTLLQSPAQKPAASIHLHQMRESHKSILGKKPSTSTGHTSRDGNNDLGVSIGHHPTYQHQSQSSQAQNKLHSNFNVGDNSGKSGNQYKVKQHQQYLKKTNILSSSANNEIYLGFPGNSKGSILGHPSRSMSSSPCSESLGGTEANPLSPLTSVGQKPVIPTDLHQLGTEFIFGKKPRGECMPKNGTFCFGASDGHYDPTYQLTLSSMLLKQDNPGPHCRSAFGQPCSITTDVDISILPSAGNNGFPSSQRQTWPSGSTFKDLADICSAISKLTISECPQGTGDARPLSQVAPSVSGHPRGVHEIGSSPHPIPNISFHPNHSNAYPSVQPPPGDNTCRPPTPNLSCNIQKPGNNGETQGSPPNSSKPEGTIRTVLHALDILKTEKMYPTESNIADCIRYGEMNFPGFDVKKALELSMRHQAVIMKKLVNDMPLFIAKDESLWKCVDVTNSNAKRPKALETVRKFLSSLGGHSAIKNSESRYQAATILRKFCLQQHALGDVLQILHIIIVRKKWIVPHSSGWQPLCFNTIVIDAASDAIGEVTS